MYKLMCRNFTKCNRSLTNFTNIYKKVIRNFESGASVQTQSVISETELHPVEEPKKEPKPSSFFSPKNGIMLLKRSLFPRKSNEKVKLVTYSIPSRCFYSSTTNKSKNDSKSTRKVFKDKKFLKMYKTAIQQCTKIKLQRQRMHKPYEVCWRPKPYQDVFLKEEKVIAGKRKLDALSIKPVPQLPKIETNAPLKIDEQRRIKLKWQKAMNRNNKKSLKIVYPTHLIQFRLSMQKPYHINQPKEATQEKPEQPEKPALSNNKYCVINGVDTIEFIPPKGEKRKNLEKLMNANRAPGQNSPEDKPEIFDETLKHLIKVHPTQRRVTKTAKMSINKKYNVFLLKNQRKAQTKPVNKQEPNSEEKTKPTRNAAGEDPTSPDDGTDIYADSTEVTEMQKDPLKLETSENKSTSKIIQHPILPSNKLNSLERRIRYPKNILAEKIDSFDIDDVCLKTKLSPGSYTNESSRKIDWYQKDDTNVQNHQFLDGQRKNQDETVKTDTNTTDPTKKHIVQSDKTKEISYEEMNSSRKDIAGYLRKLNGLKEQTALARSKITKSMYANTDMVQKVEVRKKMPEEKKQYEVRKTEGKPEQNRYQEDRRYEVTKGKTTSVVEQITKKLPKASRDDIKNYLRQHTDYKSKEIKSKSKLVPLKDFKTSKSKYLLENFKPIETVLSPKPVSKPKPADELPQKALSKTNRNFQKILDEYKVERNALNNPKEVSRTEPTKTEKINKRTSNMSENITNIFAEDVPTPKLEKTNEKSDSSVHRVPTKKYCSSSDIQLSEDLNIAKSKEITETPNKNHSIKADTESKQISNAHEAGDITKDKNDLSWTENVKEKIKYFEKKLVRSNKEPEQSKKASKPISNEIDPVNHKENTKLDKMQVQREEESQRKTNDPASEKSAKYTTAKRELDKHLTKQQNKKLAKKTFKYILKDVEDEEPTTNNSKKQEDLSGVSENFTEAARTTHADINQNETKTNTDENKVTSLLSRQKKERDSENKQLENAENKSVTADNIKKIDMNEKGREKDENIKDELKNSINKIKSASDTEQKLFKTIVKETYVIIEEVNYVSKDKVAGDIKKNILQEKANKKVIKENDNENEESMKVEYGGDLVKDDKKNDETEQVTENLKETEIKKTMHPNELRNYARMKVNNVVRKTSSSVDIGDKISNIGDKNIPTKSLDRNTTCSECEDYKSGDAKKNNNITEEVSKHSIIKETKKTEPSKNLLGHQTGKELRPNEISNKKVSEEGALILTTKLTRELKNLLTSKHRDRSQIISPQSWEKDEQHLNSESKKHTTSKNGGEQSENLIVDPVVSNPKVKSNTTPDAKKNDTIEEASKHFIIKETNNLETKKTEPSKNLLTHQPSTQETLENEISNKKAGENQVIILITNPTNELKKLLTTSKHGDTSQVILSESLKKDEAQLNAESTMKKHTTSKNVAKQSEKPIVDPVVGNSKGKSNMTPSNSVPALISNKDTESRGGITSLTDFVSLHNKPALVKVKEDKKKELQIIKNKHEEKDSLFQNNRPTIRKEQPPLQRDDNKKQKSKTKKDIVFPPRKGQTTPQLSSNKPIINHNTTTVNNNSQSRDNLINRDKYEKATVKKYLQTARSVKDLTRKPKPISRDKQLIAIYKNDNADNESIVFKIKPKTIQNFDEIDKTTVNTNKPNVKVSNTERKEKMQISEEFKKSRTNIKKTRAQSALLKMYLLEENELTERPFESTNARKRPSLEQIKRPNIKQTNSEKTKTKEARNLAKKHSLNKSFSISKKPAGKNDAKMTNKCKSLEEMNQEDNCKDCFPLQANVDKKIQRQTSKSVEHKADHGKETNAHGNEDKKLVLVLTLPKLNDLSKVPQGDKENDTTKTGSSSSSPNLNSGTGTKLASNGNQSKQEKEPGQKENLSKRAAVKTKSETSVKRSNRLDAFCSPDACFKETATRSKELPVKKSPAHHNKLNEDKSQDTKNDNNPSPKLTLKVLLPKTDNKAEKMENVSKSGSNQTEAVSVIRRKSESDLIKKPARKMDTTEKAPGPGKDKKKVIIRLCRDTGFSKDVQKSTSSPNLKETPPNRESRSSNTDRLKNTVNKYRGSTTKLKDQHGQNSIENKRSKNTLKVQSNEANKDENEINYSVRLKMDKTRSSASKYLLENQIKKNITKASPTESKSSNEKTKLVQKICTSQFNANKNRIEKSSSRTNLKKIVSLSKYCLENQLERLSNKYLLERQLPFGFVKSFNKNDPIINLKTKTEERKKSSSNYLLESQITTYNNKRKAQNSEDENMQVLLLKKRKSNQMLKTHHESNAKTEQYNENDKGPKRNDIPAVEAKINEIFHLKDKVAKFNKKLSKYVQPKAQLTPAEKNEASLTKNEKNDAKEQGMKTGTQSKRDEDLLDKPAVRVTKTTVEKTLPTLPAVKKIEKSLTVYSKFCNQLCIPPKTVSQVVFSKPAEDLTTLNKNNARQIVLAPKKHLEKYKNLKITFITLKRHQEKNESEDFLPAITPSKRNDSKRVNNLDFRSDTAEMMAFRYELLKKLHEEFSSLMDQQENEGSFEKVVENYKRIMEKHTENKLKMSKTPPTKSESTILKPKPEQTLINKTESLLKNLNKHKLQDNTSNNDKSGKDAKSPQKPKDDPK